MDECGACERGKERFYKMDKDKGGERRALGEPRRLKQRQKEKENKKTKVRDCRRRQVCTVPL